MKRPSDAGRGPAPSPATASSRVHVEWRKHIVSDGPFSETKEWLGSAGTPAQWNLTTCEGADP
jgi:hypothetical protein